MACALTSPMGQTRYVEEMVEDEDEDGEDTEIELVVQVTFTLVQTKQALHLNKSGIPSRKRVDRDTAAPKFMPVWPDLINP